MDMRTPVIGGLVLFPAVATLIELVALIAILAKTRAEQTYVQQLGSGLIATAVSLVPIVVGFVLTVFVLFPDLVASMQAETRATMQAAGSSPEEIEAALSMMSTTAQGLAGVIGTAVTGVFVSALAAIGLRKRG